jgi:hypothetical protein
MYPDPRDRRFEPTIISDTDSALDDLQRKLGIERFISRGKRTVSSLCGRASDNHPPALVDDATNICKTMSPNKIPRYRIRANGDVTISCLSTGTRGSTFGNVLENDAEQLYKAYHEFMYRFACRIGLNQAQRNRPLGNLVCQAHQTCDIRIMPPRSNDPVVKRRAVA